jgi:hypothetical protein
MRGEPLEWVAREAVARGGRSALEHFMLRKIQDSYPHDCNAADLEGVGVPTARPLITPLITGKLV